MKPEIYSHNSIIITLIKMQTENIIYRKVLKLKIRSSTNVYFCFFGFTSTFYYILVNYSS